MEWDLPSFLLQKNAILECLVAEQKKSMKQKKRKLTSNIVKASFVKNPRKELEANDGVDEDDEDDQQGDVKQGDHGHNDTVEHHLQT